VTGPHAPEDQGSSREPSEHANMVSYFNGSAPGWAAVMSPKLGAWIRAQRRARGWAVNEMARLLIEAARNSGDNTVPGREAMCRNIRRWEGGKGGVSERYMLHYCKALGILPGEFGPACEPERGGGQESSGSPEALVAEVLRADPDGAGCVVLLFGTHARRIVIDVSAPGDQAPDAGSAGQPAEAAETPGPVEIKTKTRKPRL
jgi:hypothetical protein